MKRIVTGALVVAGLAAAWAAAAGFLTLFGVIHSPWPDGRLFLPWNLADAPAGAGGGPLELAAAYGILALLFAAWGAVVPGNGGGARPER